jgi:hypothetical protein
MYIYIYIYRNSDTWCFYGIQTSIRIMNICDHHTIFKCGFPRPVCEGTWCGSGSTHTRHLGKFRYVRRTLHIHCCIDISIYMIDHIHMKITFVAPMARICGPTGLFVVIFDWCIHWDIPQGSIHIYKYISRGASMQVFITKRCKIWTAPFYG